MLAGIGVDKILLGPASETMQNTRIQRTKHRFER